MLKVFVVVVLVTVSMPALACESYARNELEKVFCQVKAKKRGALPYSLKDFRKNPPQTQRLLLKRPAAALGLTLPAAATDTVAPKAVPHSSAAVAKAKPKPNASKKPQASLHAPVHAPAPLAGRCVLQGERIQCGDSDFKLLSNVRNEQLAPEAFGHTLTLAAFDPDTQSPTELGPYLAKSYGAYIDGMVRLGLAASTMSYTKFHHTYLEVARLGEPFHQRMGQMYEFLKRDKATIGVKKRYTALLPEALTQCMPLESTYIVCDDVKHNWVYQKVSTDK